MSFFATAICLLNRIFSFALNWINCIVTFYFLCCIPFDQFWFWARCMFCKLRKYLVIHVASNVTLVTLVSHKTLGWPFKPSWQNATLSSLSSAGSVTRNPPVPSWPFLSLPHGCATAVTCTLDQASPSSFSIYSFMHQCHGPLQLGTTLVSLHLPPCQMLPDVPFKLALMPHLHPIAMVFM